MPSCGKIGRRVGVIDEIAVQRRLVATADEPDGIALQPVDRQRVFLAQLCGQFGIGGVAQLFSGRPEVAAAGGEVQIAAHVIAVADRDAAIVVAEIGGESDGIFVGRGLPDRLFRLGDANDRIAQHAADSGGGQSLEVLRPGRRGPFGQIDAALVAENDFRDFGRAGGGRNRDFDPRVGAEGAVRVEADRPDAQPVRDGVIKPVFMRREAEYAPLRRGVAPGFRPRAVELRAGDIDAGTRAGRRRRKPDCGETGKAVIIGPQIGAVQAETMDQAGLAIGDEKRFRVRIIGQTAQRGARIGFSAGDDIGEQGNLAREAVDLPDRSRPAARPPLPGHEARAGGPEPDALNLAVWHRRDDGEPIG